MHVVEYLFLAMGMTTLAKLLVIRSWCKLSFTRSMPLSNHVPSV